MNRKELSMSSFRSQKENLVKSDQTADLLHKQTKSGVVATLLGIDTSDTLFMKLVKASINAYHKLINAENNNEQSCVITMLHGVGNKALNIPLRVMKPVKDLLFNKPLKIIDGINLNPPDHVIVLDQIEASALFNSIQVYDILTQLYEKYLLTEKSIDITSNAQDLADDLRKLRSYESLLGKVYSKLNVVNNKGQVLSAVKTNDDPKNSIKARVYDMFKNNKLVSYGINNDDTNYRQAYGLINLYEDQNLRDLSISLINYMRVVQAYENHNDLVHIIGINNANLHIKISELGNQIDQFLSPDVAKQALRIYKDMAHSQGRNLTLDLNTLINVENMVTLTSLMYQAIDATQDDADMFDDIHEIMEEYYNIHPIVKKLENLHPNIQGFVNKNSINDQASAMLKNTKFATLASTSVANSDRKAKVGIINLALPLSRATLGNSIQCYLKAFDAKTNHRSNFSVTMLNSKQYQASLSDLHKSRALLDNHTANYLKDIRKKVAKDPIIIVGRLQNSALERAVIVMNWLASKYGNKKMEQDVSKKIGNIMKFLDPSLDNISVK